MMPKKFEMTEQEHRDAEEWLAQHRADVATRKMSWARFFARELGDYLRGVSHHVTYSFTVGAVGTVVELRCDCGAYFDATDYGSW